MGIKRANLDTIELIDDLENSEIAEFLTADDRFLKALSHALLNPSSENAQNVVDVAARAIVKGANEDEYIKANREALQRDISESTYWESFREH